MMITRISFFATFCKIFFDYHFIIWPTTRASSKDSLQESSWSPWWSPGYHFFCHFLQNFLLILFYYSTHHHCFQQGLSPRITTMITIRNWILHICLAFTRTYQFFAIPIILSTNNVKWVNLPAVPKSREEKNFSAEGFQLTLQGIDPLVVATAVPKFLEGSPLTVQGWQELTHYCAISPAEITMLTNLDFTQHRFNNWEMCVSSEQVW